MTPQKQRLLIMILAGIFGLLILIGVGFTIFASQKGKIVIVDIVPSDSTVKLDGKNITKGTHYIEPGKHEFVVNRPAFLEKKTEFEIQKGETKNFELYIFSDGEAGLQWNLQNPEESARLDGYVSKEYDEAADRLTGYEIIKELPITDTGFRIDKGVSEKGNDFALYIQSDDDAGKQAALDTLRYLGYNPDNYEIIYTKPE